VPTGNKSSHAFEHQRLCDSHSFGSLKVYQTLKSLHFHTNCIPPKCVTILNVQRVRLFNSLRDLYPILVCAEPIL